MESKGCASINHVARKHDTVIVRQPEAVMARRHPACAPPGSSHCVFPVISFQKYHLRPMREWLSAEPP